MIKVPETLVYKKRRQIFSPFSFRMSVRGVLGCGNECVIIFVGGSAFLSSSLEDNSKLILNVAFGASEFRRKSFVRGTLFRINLADWVTCLKNSSSEESILESF